MRKVQIALVEGDGSGPEMMAPATLIAVEAARKDGIDIEFVPTPMGWNAYLNGYGDTLPLESMTVATTLGLLFFGGVGDPQYDLSLGSKCPEMMPETRCLLTIRGEWNLMINTRPVIYYPELKHIAKVREDAIPEGGIQQIWLRFLLEDGYFGNRHFLSVGGMAHVLRKFVGVCLKHEVTGKEDFVSDIAFYRRSSLEAYFCYAFILAEKMGLPVICVDKANILPRYAFWRKIARMIHEQEFSGVGFKELYVDNACQMLFDPSLLNGVIVCGNEHGDILSDGAASAVGSMGLMCSSAVNPETGVAMFESGTGTFPQARGTGKANPIGRILTAALMLKHIGAVKGADAIEKAVREVLRQGFRTADIARKGDTETRIVGTEVMGRMIFSNL